MRFNILLLPGDGIGPEISQQAIDVLAVIGKRFNISFEVESGAIGGSAIDQTGVPLPEKTLHLAQQSDAILLAAVGGPKWADNHFAKRPEQGLLDIREKLDLFANLRPALLFPELAFASSLKADLVCNLDMLIVRELTSGIYFGEPRELVQNNNHERYAFNTMRYSEHEIIRIARVAFELAMQRGKKLCSVDKANVLEVSQLWRCIVEEVAQEFPEVQLSHLYVDNAAMQLVREPKQFDVILTGNLFGDILSDCAAMLTGSIGLLPSASLNEDKLGLFEPVHGSAPELAGKNQANPLAMLLSTAMMLRVSLKQNQAADCLEQAIQAVLKQGLRTQDIMTTGMTLSSTEQMGRAVIEQIKQIGEN